MKAFSARLDQAKRNYNTLIEHKTALTAERQDGITQYEDIYERIQPSDEELSRKNVGGSAPRVQAGFRKPFPKSMVTSKIQNKII